MSVSTPSAPGITMPGNNPDEYSGSHVGHIVNRSEEYEALKTGLGELQAGNLYLHGPRGSGKTLITRTVLEEISNHVNTHYIPCTLYDTQYKVLRQLYHRLTDDPINDGYHTAQLQNRVKSALADRTTVIVLDEIDFLFENDGNDLLYYLSRLTSPDNLCLVGISANHPDFTTIADERTYSSLQPFTLNFEPYTQQEAYNILVNRVRSTRTVNLPQVRAIQYVANVTSNMRFGLHWLAWAAKQEPTLTEETLQSCQHESLRVYWDILLSEFSTHHHMFLDAINELSIAYEDPIPAGDIYEQYKHYCGNSDTDPLSNRRISDYINHLALLNIITINHQEGGSDGNTRWIQLTSPLDDKTS